MSNALAIWRIKCKISKNIIVGAIAVTNNNEVE